MSENPHPPALELADEIRTKLGALNVLLFGPPGDARMGFEYIAIGELKEQDVNANVMPPEMFKQLVQNIRNSGVMESVPLCATRAGSEVREVVSGHHRVRGAAEAGQTHIVVLVYYNLAAAEIIAKQLAHNSIQGTSDAQLVAALFGQINRIDLQIESFINPNALRVPDPVSFKPTDIDLLKNSKTVTFVFLDTQAQDLSRALELLGASPDSVYVAHREAFENFKAAVTRTRRDLDVRAMPSAIAHMSRIVLEKLDALDPEARTRDWVPIADVFRTTFIPPALAEQVRNAIDTMRDRGHLGGEAWQALETWASETNTH